uniref:uncharacterized protein LOC122594850 n=1 Tax=Erigeron canadensis TaxID=72917 RepID=UPI001CB97703|nr:uncharacterized protein LOC122594850 [Erigeron canadensis]
MAKKLWGIIRVILYMMKKGISTNIPWFEIHMMLKRSTKLAGKAIGNLLLDHHQSLSSAFTCRPNNIHKTFIQPLEYEFSFTNTPLFHPKRKNKRRHHLFNHTVKNSYHHQNHNNESSVNNVKRVFDILNSYENHCETTSFGEQETVKSPLTLLGFGESTNVNVRQLRVTDSPFPVNNNDEEDTLQVDKAAEEFIKNFYNELKKQKKRAAVEPPSPLPPAYHKWGHVR